MTCLIFILHCSAQPLKKTNLNSSPSLVHVCIWNRVLGWSLLQNYFSQPIQRRLAPGPEGPSETEAHQLTKLYTYNIFLSTSSWMRKEIPEKGVYLWLHSNSWCHSITRFFSYFVNSNDMTCINMEKDTYIITSDTIFHHNNTRLQKILYV